MTYTNLEQRMAQSYIDLFPTFIPDENELISIDEQKRFYNLMHSIYQLARNEPHLLFLYYMRMTSIQIGIKKPMENLS